MFLWRAAVASLTNSLSLYISSHESSIIRGQFARLFENSKLAYFTNVTPSVLPILNIYLLYFAVSKYNVVKFWVKCVSTQH